MKVQEVEVIRLVSVLVVLFLLAACNGAPDYQAPSVKSISAEEQAHRDAVIRFSEDLVDRDSVEILRKSYAALDAGENSREVRDAGGIATVRFNVRRAELIYETRPIRNCIQHEFGNDKPAFAKAFPARIIASGRLQDLISDAERFASVEYLAILALHGRRPTDEIRAAAAFEALTTDLSPDRSGLQNAKMFDYMAAASDGKCRSSPRLVALIKQAP